MRGTREVPECSLSIFIRCKLLPYTLDRCQSFFHLSKGYQQSDSERLLGNVLFLLSTTSKHTRCDLQTRPLGIDSNELWTNFWICQSLQNCSGQLYNTTEATVKHLNVPSTLFSHKLSTGLELSGTFFGIEIG